MAKRCEGRPRTYLVTRCCSFARERPEQQAKGHQPESGWWPHPRRPTACSASYAVIVSVPKSSASSLSSASRRAAFFPGSSLAISRSIEHTMRIMTSP